MTATTEATGSLTDDERRRLAAAFWHRTRLCVVPLTVADLDRRLGRGRALRQAAIAAGMIRRSVRGEIDCYDLTETGREWLPQEAKA